MHGRYNVGAHDMFKELSELFRYVHDMFDVLTGSCKDKKGPYKRGRDFSKGDFL
jgi:hypothetical protein